MYGIPGMLYMLLWGFILRYERLFLIQWEKHQWQFYNPATALFRALWRVYVFPSGYCLVLLWFGYGEGIIESEKRDTIDLPVTDSRMNQRADSVPGLFVIHFCITAFVRVCFCVRSQICTNLLFVVSASLMLETLEITGFSTYPLQLFP